ncbi:MAG: GNAT family N-acetyltransferase [Methanomassiliicoccales archaeon]|nr:MAG: GNAT family N-acetyltransferase [Methanomassiliicoccales archaeon]
MLEKVNNDNFDDFFNLIVELARFEHLDPPDNAGKARLREHALSNTPFYEAYIGRLGGRPIAYLIYFFTYSSFLAKPTLYLEDIFILEEQRGKGFGKELFLFCVQRAKDMGCGRVEWSALNWNERAIRFYRSMGAEPLSEWTYFRLTEGAIESLLERNGRLTR